MSGDDEFTEVRIRTRHPEHYLLTNTEDGTRWRIRDGRWSQIVRADGERYDVLTQDSIIDRLHRHLHKGNPCRQGVTCQRLATASTLGPVVLAIATG